MLLLMLFLRQVEVLMREHGFHRLELRLGLEFLSHRLGAWKWSMPPTCHDADMMINHEKIGVQPSFRQIHVFSRI